MRVGHPSGPPAWAATSARWECSAMSCLARWGSTVAAASVPATTTVWCSRAETILAGPGGDGPPAAASCARPGPYHASRAGRGLGERLAPDAALGLVDGSGQVQVESREHRQGGHVLVRGADGAQGVRHAPGRTGDDGSVPRIGLGATRCQVGDASHGQSGQVAHGGAHVLSHRQGP